VTLAPDRGSSDHLASFFELVCQDPVVRDVTLIAEPWDLSADQVGRYPDREEWNDRYRDDRARPLAPPRRPAAMGWRSTRSVDLYGQTAADPMPREPRHHPRRQALQTS
jgi:isoamylase